MLLHLYHTLDYHTVKKNSNVLIVSLQMRGTWLPWSLHAGDTFHALGITKYDLVPKIDSFISVQQLKTQLQNR